MTMNFNGVKVLLLDGSGRQTLSVLYGLKKIGCHVTVVCTSKLDVCSSSRFPDKKIIDKSAHKDGLIELVKKEVLSRNYDVLLPVTEISTNLITKHEKEISKYVRIACAKYDVFIQAHNKQLTFEKAMEIGIPCPHTRRIDEPIEEYLNKVTFPIIVKPRSGVGSIGFKKIENKELIEKLIAEKKIDPDDYVIQEFIPAEKIRGVNIFMADGQIKGALSNSVPRHYPIEAGSATIVTAVDDKKAIEYSSCLLNAMGWRGYADVSYLIDDRDGSLKLLEINGRINASVKLYFYCGYNLSEQLLEMAYEVPITSYPINTKFGFSVRHSQADILWFLHSSDRFRTKPSFFNRRKTKDVVFSLRDPWPYITYTIQHIFSHREFTRSRNRNI